MKRIICLLILLTPIAFAQVALGTPRYGSMSGGGIDIINNANLNVHVGVPILSKHGRGMDFSYMLGYDSSIWTKVTSGSTTTWQPISTYWGWEGETQAATGYIHYGHVLTRCYSDLLPGYVWYWRDTYDAYYDANGTPHSFNLEVYFCDDDQHSEGGTVTLSDGSGYTVTIDPTNGNTVKTAKGAIISPPTTTTFANGSVQDNNGNIINAAASGGTFTDTLGSTALTIAGSGTPASPKTYTYTDPSGTSRTITVNYSSLYVRTNFACTGVTDYGTNGTTTANLISSIALPNGTSYSFTYEDTPGYSGYVTGRIKQVTLPTGGTIQYVYSGGDTSKGIYCDDGSTSYLDRTTSDGTIYYRRSHVDALGHWQTTLIYPTSDQTVIHFQKVQSSTLFVETQREIWSGAPGTGVLKAKSISCYNTCVHGKGGTGLGDAVALPITVIDTDNYTDNARVSGTWRSFDTLGAPTQVNEYTFGSLSGARGSLVRYTTTTYTNLSNGAHVPSEVKVMEPSSPSDIQKAKTTYAYDAGTPTATSAVQHAAVGTVRGNVTSVTQWSDGGTDPVTALTYFDTGMVRSVTDPGGHTTNFDYTDNFSDAPAVHNTFAFVKTVTNHLSQVVSTSKYHWPSAALLRSTEQHGARPVRLCTVPKQLHGFTDMTR